MDIKLEKDGDEGSFYIDQQGKRLGEMRYAIEDDNTMNIYHTEVSDELRGQNMGKKLVEAGVNYARENNLKIAPSCTFAKTVFARNKDYRDVLA